MKNIGILGGTFDPIHKGHIKMAQLARAELSLDRIILVPSGNPPHKEQGVSDKSHRLEICRLAANEYGFEVSDYEINQETMSYTVNTLEYFQGQYPQDKIFFILGGDSLDYVEQWYNAEKLLKLCELVAIPRRGVSPKKMDELAKMLKEKYGAVCHVINSDYIDISSTQVREAIGIGLYIPSMLPLSVIEFIREKRLYR